MSPVSSSNLIARGARFQVPFTLSDTWTCPGALYSATHPTSRSPRATGRLSVTVVAEVGAVENAVPWAKVGAATAACGSGTPRVVSTTRAAVDRAEGKCFTAIPSLTKMTRDDPRHGGSWSRPGFWPGADVGCSARIVGR